MITTHPQITDGTPHLAYYDSESLLSFVWTGNPAADVLVQRGGYGEPIIATFDPQPFLPPWALTAHETITAFKVICTRWSDAWDGC